MRHGYDTFKVEYHDCFIVCSIRSVSLERGFFDLVCGVLALDVVSIRFIDGFMIVCFTRRS